ncbi:hypothetical protein [Streptomyces sp. NPDC057426]|uniref:hypothetical protein n=1 Tax=Streptomyces sp. NPDC057426 TaxID=3346128 RepID=UPI003682ABF2
MSGASTAPAELRRLIDALIGPGGTAQEGAAVVAERNDDRAAVAAVRSARPARALARALARELPPTSAAAVLLSELTARHLAGSGARWRRLHDALTTAQGTLPELLAALPVPTGPKRTGSRPGRSVTPWRCSWSGQRPRIRRPRSPRCRSGPWRRSWREAPSPAPC